MLSIVFAKAARRGKKRYSAAVFVMAACPIVCFYNIYTISTPLSEEEMSESLFEINDWTVSRHGLIDNHRLIESIMSIGNGYMGMRGNFEEKYSGDCHQGIYVAGVWFPDKTRVGWWKNGYPQYFGKVINAVNFAGTDITINGQTVDLSVSSYEDFFMELDMSDGLLTRSYTVLQPDCRVKLTFRRFFSISERRLAHFHVDVEVMQGSAEITLCPALDGDVHNQDSNYGECFWSIEEISSDKNGFIRMKTVPNPFSVPQFTVSAGMKNTLSIDTEPHRSCERGQVRNTFAFTLKEGGHAALEKTAAVITDRDTPPGLHHETVDKLLEKASEKTFWEHLQIQKAAWAERWAKSDVRIKGCKAAQQGIRYNIFQLFCTYYGEDDRLNIGPKGFTGEKYGGATYWDTEAYIIPMYLAIAEPEVSKKLLKYRYNQLEGAYHNARQQGLAGALFPMVTFNGIECHNEWEITFEEIHRNGAVAYAIYYYTTYTGDRSYLFEYGLPVLVGISRFWADRVHYCANRDCYMLHGVTGPNEYENNVNNNWYTNTIAKWVMQYTVKCLRESGKERQNELGVTEDEIACWTNISEHMYLPENRELGIFVQHDTFLDKELRTTDTLLPEERPLNQHWSWDRILRSCFIKQADVLQGLYFFGDQYTMEQKIRNFDFYEPMTVHESSLSPCVHAILAAEIGRMDKAEELYARTSRLDLDNYNKDTEDGLHITSMSGSWLAIVQGFAGMRTSDGGLRFSPFCPKSWKGYSFRINYRGRILFLEVNQKQVSVTLQSGEGLTLKIHGHPVTLSPENSTALVRIPAEGALGEHHEN